MICERMEYEYENNQWEKRTATQGFSVARFGNGRDRAWFLSIGYTGHDARKVFKQDCLTFSRINMAQLYAFNDSQHNPMIFFYNDLVPIAHIFQNHLDCQTVFA
ncbi:hypothetical protein L218DRAFT_555691 [Marasmius fiardii PR-910]|nr:hypothetical protein L218DRAFT_555691 [Marasmius fiardii PR-910]